LHKNNQEEEKLLEVHLKNSKELLVTFLLHLIIGLSNLSLKRVGENKQKPNFLEVSLLTFFP
jgi:hypothetical protein